MNSPSLLRAPRQFKMAPAEPKFLAWAVVVAVAILSFFVHTLHDGIERGESLRAAQRSGGSYAGTETAQAPGWTRTVAVSANTSRSR